MPSALVVKKGVKSLSATAAEMPTPWSVTENMTQRVSAGITRRLSTRSLADSVLASRMACMPLRQRLSKTCSTMVRSHSTALQLSSTSINTRTCSLRACRLTSGMMASSNARGVTHSRTWSRRRTKSCTLLMTLPARSACSLMRLSASCRSAARGAVLAPASSSRFKEPVA